MNSITCYRRFYVLFGLLSILSFLLSAGTSFLRAQCNITDYIDCGLNSPCDECEPCGTATWPARASRCDASDSGYTGCNGPITAPCTYSRECVASTRDTCGDQMHGTPPVHVYKCIKPAGSTVSGSIYIADFACGTVCPSP